MYWISYILYCKQTGTCSAPIKYNKSIVIQISDGRGPSVQCSVLDRCLVDMNFRARIFVGYWILKKLWPKCCWSVVLDGGGRFSLFMLKSMNCCTKFVIFIDSTVQEWNFSLKIELWYWGYNMIISVSIYKPVELVYL